MYVCIPAIVLFDDDTGTEDAVEEQISAYFARVGTEADDDAVQAKLGCRSGCQAGVVGLYATDGNDRRRFADLGFANKVFQLAQLIATAAEGRQIVPLDIHFT